MQSRTSILSAFTLSSGMAFGAAAIAADLPKSGTIKTHIGLKENSVAVPVGEKHVLFANTTGAVIYNDAGNGPLHGDAWNCAYSVDFDNGAAKLQGYCASGDASGLDRIFVTFSGAGSGTGGAGTGVITGGTGRYSGIQGKLAYQCKPADAGRASTIARSNSTISYNNLSSKSLNRREEISPNVVSIAEAWLIGDSN